MSTTYWSRMNEKVERMEALTQDTRSNRTSNTRIHLCVETKNNLKEDTKEEGREDSGQSFQGYSRTEKNLEYVIQKKLEQISPSEKNF